MTAAEFLTAFPEVLTNVSTGGNCTAWTLPLLGAESYVLITTHQDEPCQPSIVDRRAAFGVYKNHAGTEPRVMTWAQASWWLRGVLAARDALTEWKP